MRSLSVRIVSRRDLLTGTAASVGLAACDRLVLPEVEDLPTDALPPITSNADFYVTSIGLPEVEREGWQIVVTDNEEPIGVIDGALLDSLTPRDTERTLECIGSSESNQAIGNAVWSGLPLSEVLEAAGIPFRSDALEIRMAGADGYRTSLPRTDVERPMWLVWKMNGVELPREHGFPARLLSPGRWGTKNVKWLVGLDLLDEPFTGYWEARGWSNDATYKANTFVTSPPSRVSVAGPVVLLGTAFAGEDEIARVEISSDGGTTWADAEITYSNGPGIWALWRFELAAEPGDYVLIARCTAASGATSNDDGGASLDGYDASMTIELTIT